MADINQVQLPDGSQYNIKDTMSGYATTTYVQDQISAITKATIGLGNVDNTSDMDKPVSTAQQTAIDAKANNSTIAYTESSATATKRYEIGDQFILSGVLYTATAIIPNGGAITVGTNCSASDSIATQIDTIENAVATKAERADLASISITGTTNNTGSTIASGKYFYLNGTYVKAIVDIANGATLTLNTNYEIATVGNSLFDISLRAFTYVVRGGCTANTATHVPMPSNYQQVFVVIYNSNRTSDYAEVALLNNNASGLVRIKQSPHITWNQVTGSTITFTSDSNSSYTVMVLQ